MASARTEVYEPTAWEDVPCLFCGARERRLHERFGYEFRFTWVTCLRCGLIYQSPRPRYDEGFVQTAYEGDHRVADPGVFPAEDVRKAKLQLGPIVEEILRYDTRRTALLEVGACGGLFISVAKPYWKEVVGVEISRVLARYIEHHFGVKVLTQQFETIPADRRYSCIHMSHVIEHIPNPGEWLEKAHELLEDQGILVVAVPHIHSAANRFKLLLKRLKLRKGDWKRASKTPDHLFEPPIPVLQRFLEAHGFEVLSTYTYSRKDETSRTPLNRLLRRRMPLGSNVRIIARRKDRKPTGTFPGTSGL